MCIAPIARRLDTITLAALVLVALGGCSGSSSNDGGEPSPAPPTIAVNVPSAPTLNRTVTLTADAEAEAGVTRVEFLVDESIIGNLTTPPFEVEWDTSTVADGTYSITGRVTDAEDVVVTSDPVSVEVRNQPTIEVVLSPEETFPRPDSTASGSGELTFDLVSGTVSGEFTVEGIDATLAHIHRGFAGTDGPVIVDFEQSDSDPDLWVPVAGSLLTAEQVDDLLAGRLYVNVHSDAYPAGEIRGQLRPDNIQVVLTELSGESVVPPVATDASGVAATTVDSVAETLTVHMNTEGVDDASEAHVHAGAADENSTDVLVELEKDAADPAHWSVELQSITAADIATFEENGWYIDVHTPANPDGELRGQVTPNPEPEPPPPEEAATLSELQNDIFTPICSACHTGGGSDLPASMNLSSQAETHAALVGVASTQQPAVLRVAVGDSENSYLIHKLEGRASITGERMPLGGPFLDQADIDRVKSWIDAGAENN